MPVRCCAPSRSTLTEIGLRGPPNGYPFLVELPHSAHSCIGTNHFPAEHYRMRHEPHIPNTYRSSSPGPATKTLQRAIVSRAPEMIGRSHQTQGRAKSSPVISHRPGSPRSSVFTTRYTQPCMNHCPRSQSLSLLIPLEVLLIHHPGAREITRARDSLSEMPRHSPLSHLAGQSLKPRSRPWESDDLHNHKNHTLILRPVWEDSGTP